MATTETTTPTLEDVAALEAELAESRKGLEDAQAKANEAAQTARKNPADDDAIRAQVEAKARAEAYAGRISDLESEIPVARESALKAEAQKRMTAIKRAHGSLKAEYDGDDLKRLVEAVGVFRDAAARINSRYHDLAILGLEAEALSARFELPPLGLGVIFPPARVDQALKALGAVLAIRLNGWLRPRDAAKRLVDIAGTPGAKLIEEAGPTEAQRKAAEEAERKARERAEKEKEALRPVAGLMKDVERLARAGVEMPHTTTGR